MRHTVVISNGTYPLPHGLIDASTRLFVADGGLARITDVASVPESAVLIGDLDSADPAAVERWEASGRRVERHRIDKDATDLELALAAATNDLGRDERLLVIGGDGIDRFDHLIGELTVIAGLGRRVSVVYGAALIEVLHDLSHVVLRGSPGDIVSLVPWGASADGVTTEGLRWALHEARLDAGTSRGMSNEFATEFASVSLGCGSLLIIQPAALAALQSFEKNSL